MVLYRRDYRYYCCLGNSPILFGNFLSITSMIQMRLQSYHFGCRAKTRGWRALRLARAIATDHRFFIALEQ